MCTDCAIGSYNDRNNSAECQECGAGSFGELKGATGCVACPIGSISAVNGSSACSDCAKGRFAASGTSVVSHFFEIFKFPSLIRAFGSAWRAPPGAGARIASGARTIAPAAGSESTRRGPDRRGRACARPVWPGHTRTRRAESR
jgi:hypothetical protein